VRGQQREAEIARIAEVDRLADVVDARIRGSISAADLAGIIVGIVVGDEKNEIAIRLRQQRVDRILQQRRAVAHGQPDRNLWHGGCVHTASLSAGCRSAVMACAT
jgi:hypothetical protein